MSPERTEPRPIPLGALLGAAIILAILTAAALALGDGALPHRAGAVVGSSAVRLTLQGLAATHAAALILAAIPAWRQAVRARGGRSHGSDAMASQARRNLRRGAEAAVPGLALLILCFAACVAGSSGSPWLEVGRIAGLGVALGTQIVLLPASVIAALAQRRLTRRSAAAGAVEFERGLE